DKLDTPGYGFLPRLGGENRSPDIKDERCVDKIGNGIGCVASDYVAAMAICNSHSDCGGFICWDSVTNDAVRSCYPLVAPMHLGDGGVGSLQNAYVKQGAEILQNGASTTPFPFPPPPPSPEPSSSPSPSPSESPLPDQTSQGEGTTRGDAETTGVASSSLSEGRTMTASIVIPVTASISSGVSMGLDATSGPNGVSNGGGSSSNVGTSSSSNNSLVVGMSSVAAAIGVVGAIAFAVFLRRRKTKSAESLKSMPFSNPKPTSTSYPPHSNDGSSITAHETGHARFGGADVSNTMPTGYGANHTSDSFTSGMATPPHRQAPVIMLSPMSKAAEAFSEQSRNTPSPTPSNAHYSSAMTTTPTYPQGEYKARPEKQPFYTADIGHNHSRSPTHVSVAPPYMPHSSSQNVAPSSDVKTRYKTDGPLLSLDQPQSSARAASPPKPHAATSVAPASVSKSAYIRQTENQNVHPQSWNPRQTVNWLHSKGIASYIITIFESKFLFFTK
ncbi:hypothetical protein BC829DRAFT_391197, partial [Chytridium lagenaria]